MTIRNAQLVCMLLGVISVQLVVLGVWAVVGPLSVPDTLQRRCTSQLDDLFTGILIAIDAAMMLYGAYLR